MQIDTRSLKIQARSAMRSASPSFWQVTLVYLLLTSLLPNIIFEVFDASLATLILQTMENASTGGAMLDSALIGLFVTLVVTLVSVIVQFGFSLWGLRCWRREEENGFSSLFEGFGWVGRILMSTLLIALYSFFWMCLLCSAALPILYSTGGSVSLTGSIVSILYFCTFFIACVLIFIRYAMVPFVLIDRPDLSPFRVVGLSTFMLRGRIWTLFRLYFSFIGIFLFATIFSNAVSALVVHLTTGQLIATMGDPLAVLLMMNEPLPYWLGLAANALVSLFLLPYVTVAAAGFYDTLIQPPQPSETTHNNDIY